MKRKTSWIAYTIFAATFFVLAVLLTYLMTPVLGNYAWEQSVIVNAKTRLEYLKQHPDSVKVMLMTDKPESSQFENEINASKLLGRRKLKIVHTYQGSTIAEQLAILSQVTRDPSYFAVIGPVGSERALHAAAILSMAGVPLLPLSSISPRLSEFPHTLMVHPSVEDEIKALMTDFSTNGVTRLAIVNDDTVDWTTRGMEVEDAAVHYDMDVPVHILFNADENTDWMRFIAEERIGTTGVAVLAPSERPATEDVLAGLHSRYDKYGPLRILTLPKTDRMADIRQSLWVFATVFAMADASGLPTAETFINTALAAPVKTPLGTLSFGPNRFLSSSCSITPVAR